MDTTNIKFQSLLFSICPTPMRSRVKRSLDSAKSSRIRQMILLTASVFSSLYYLAKPGIVLRRTGKRISAAEKAAWDPKFKLWFVLPCLKPITLQGKTHIWWQLGCTENPSFLSLIRGVGCSRWLTPPETTDFTQTADNGLGRLEEYLIGLQLDEWLEEDENLD